MGGDSVKKVRTLNGDIPIFVPTSDTTLTVEGGFADAKAVGDKFAETDDKIAQVKNDVAAEVSRATVTENMKADKTALARTDRSLDALWKLNNGVSYEFQKDEAAAYQKDIPTGAKLASVEKIGGRTLTWNQLIQNGDFSLNSMWSAVGSTISVEGNTGIFTATEAALTNNKIEAYQILSGNVVKGHKYCVRFEYNLSVDINDQSVLNLGSVSTKIPVVGAGTWGKFNSIATVNVASNIFDLYFFFDSLSVGDTVKLRNVQLFDLTQMFGSGNEPSTPEEFEAMFPADYYPYNEGGLLSMPVNEVRAIGQNLYADGDLLNLTANYYTDFIPVNLTTGKIYVSFDSFADTDNAEWIVNAIYYNVNKKKLGVNGYADDVKSKSKFLFDGTSAAGNGIDVNLKNISYIKLNFYIYMNTATKISFKNIMVSETDTDYSPYHSTTHTIPQSILQLDGYGDGVTDNAYNCVDWENKKYHKKVGKVDLGTANDFILGKPLNDGSGNIFYFAGKESGFKKNGKAISNKLIYSIPSSGQWEDLKLNETCIDSGCYVVVAYNVSTLDEFKQAMSGVMLYYELAEEQITDISDLIGDTLQEPIEVEVGGSLTFQNTHGDNYRIPVPNTVEYTVKLSEVAE